MAGVALTLTDILQGLSAPQASGQCLAPLGFRCPFTSAGGAQSPSCGWWNGSRTLRLPPLFESWQNLHGISIWSGSAVLAVALPSSARFELRPDRLLANSGTGVELRRFDLRSGEATVFDRPNSHLTPAVFSWDLLSSAAGERAVDRTELIPVESHDVLLIGLGRMV